ncbi:MAG: adenylate/guanylate cyclase domain-containing protein [Ilumatobacteraceae bacterium]
MASETARQSALPSGVVTFLLTDIESSSGWWERRPVEMREALARHDELVSSVVGDHDGVVVKHLGDGCWAAFSSAVKAIDAAIDFQRRMQQSDPVDEVRLRIRIGVHTGEVEPTGHDYFGPVVNRAARLLDLANGDQIVCSSSTAALVPAAELRSEGQHELRGVGRAEVHIVLADGVRTDQRQLRGPVTRNNLPRPKNSLVGRDDDVAQIASFISEQDALVTLVGPGGVGKTRLAVEVGSRVAADLGGQVYFCDLVPVSDADALAETVAESVGARRQPGMTLVDSIADFLTDRGALVVLDNCEHVVAAARVLVARLLDAGGVRVLATSREALGLGDEQQVVVAPLPPTAGGVELFVDRARRRDHRFVLDDSNASAVHAVVERLDGIPLAIELAAARLRLMTPDEIAARLREGTDVLGRSSRGDRNETLRETIRWSYDLLPAAEAELFCRLSVFAGGFDLVAAAAICGDGDEATVTELMAALLDKSMIESSVTDGQQRFRMLETLREFAAAGLAAAEETEAVRERHAAHYLGVAEQENARLFGAAEPDVWRVLDAEWSNLRAALDTFERTGDLDRGAELVVALVWFAAMSMRFELFSWADELLEWPDVANHQRFTDLCGASAVGAYFTLGGEVTERAETGLAVNPADDEGFCRCALASVFLNNVHTAEASDALTRAWLDSDPQTVGGRLWAHGFRTFHLCSQEPGPTMFEHAAAVTEIADRTGSVTARAIAAWANGQVESFADLDTALATWRTGREWVASMPSNHLADQLLVGLELHATARRGDLTQTLEGCRDALHEALEQHYYVGVSHLFGVTSIALSRAGDARTGARLVGAMIEQGHLPRRNARRELERALDDELDDLLVMGRTMSVTQAGYVALAALDAALERESV